MQVLPISCNMRTSDLPDMYAISLWACGPQDSSTHTRKIFFTPV